MPAHFDAEKDDARFSRNFRRVFTVCAVLISLYLCTLTAVILLNNPSYMQGWRGITCIALTILILMIYSIQFHTTLKFDWPPSLRYSLSMWFSLYLIVILLTLINTSFSLDLYIVFALSFGLFGGKRLLLAVGCMALTMFAFQGLLAWPPTGGTLLAIVGQGLTLCSITGFVMLFQHLVGERFERNELLIQLTQANGELEEAHRQLAQSVAQEQELAVLRERTRLAREMHDTIGHALVLISVKLEAAQRLRERDPARCDHELEATKQVARETMTALRASIADLRSPALEHTEIKQALGRSVKELAQRTGLQITYTPQADIDQLPSVLAETIWKVSQEALANIEKHARASHVEVCLSQQDERLLLSIHDDGIGLPSDFFQSQHDGSVLYHSPPGHYGIRGMHERIEDVGGHLTLHSEEQQGTTITLDVPLPVETKPC